MPRNSNKTTRKIAPAASDRPKHRKAAEKKRVVPYLPERYAWVDEYCRKKNGCVSEYKREWDLTRYMIDGKFFVVIMQNPAGESIITLKLEPAYGHLLRTNHDDVNPGYHMNKRHWNSISLEGDFENELLEELIDESYDIIFNSLTRKAQAEILGNMRS